MPRLQLLVATMNLTDIIGLFLIVLSGSSQLGFILMQIRLE